MGKIMSWLHHLITGNHYETGANLVRSHRAEAITKEAKSITQVSDEVRQKVRVFQEADDPLAALVRTLRTNRKN